MRLFFLFLLTLSVRVAVAQTGDCATQIHDYHTLFEGHQVAEAYRVWQLTKTQCVPPSRAVYDDGLQLMMAYYSKIEEPVERVRLQKEALKLLEDCIKKYPEAVPDGAVAKAMLLYACSERSDLELEEVYGLLNSSFQAHGAAFSDVNALHIYFVLSMDSFKNKQLTGVELMDRYHKIQERCAVSKTAADGEAKSFEALLKMIEAEAAKAIPCTARTAYYEANYRTHQQDVAWLQLACHNLAPSCSGTPLFYTISGLSDDLAPTASTAFARGVASLKQQQEAAAQKYFDTAVSLSQEGLERATQCYQVSLQWRLLDKAKARDYLNQALRLQPQFGKAYFLLAQLYASSTDCFTERFDRQALFTLALQTAAQALAVDASLQKTVTAFQAQYTPQALTPKDITKAKRKGATYFLGCWIATTLTYPD